MSKTKRLVTIEIDQEIVKQLKAAVKAAKQKGIYTTQPLYCKAVILEHFKNKDNE